MKKNMMLLAQFPDNDPVSPTWTTVGNYRAGLSEARQ